MAIRVLIVDDHQAMRDMLADFIAQLPDFELCGVLGNGEEAILAIPDADPSVVLTDLSLPGMSGSELIATIEDSWRIPCIVLSGHREGSYVAQALAAGARGYVLKGNPREIPVAIRRVLRGRSYLSEALEEVDGDFWPENSPRA